MASGAGGAGESAARSPIEAERLADAGRAQHQQGKLAEARDSYRKAVALDPRNLDAVMNLGVVLAQLGCQAEAPRFLRQALALAPGEPALHTNAGIMFAELGRWNDAGRALERAIAIDPRAQLAYETLGFVLAENGQRAHAAAGLARAIALDPRTPGPHFRLHTALFDDFPRSRPLREGARRRGRARDLEERLVPLLLRRPPRHRLGDAKGARRQFDEVNPDGSHRGALESWEYVKAHSTPTTRASSPRRATRSTTLSRLRAARDGFVVEMGVRYGLSARWVAERLSGRRRSSPRLR